MSGVIPESLLFAPDHIDWGLTKIAGGWTGYISNTAPYTVGTRRKFVSGGTYKHVVTVLDAYAREWTAVYVAKAVNHYASKPNRDDTYNG